MNIPCLEGKMQRVKLNMELLTPFCYDENRYEGKQWTKDFLKIGSLA